MMRVLAVIPARGGSKGIPRKNMRLLRGRPLIDYAIKNAIQCGLIHDVIVSSDSDEILGYACQYKQVDCHKRDASLAQDTTTLDSVVYDAVISAEKQRMYEYDIVVTLQPTSPLLTEKTLSAALKKFQSEACTDTMISVVNAPHLSWKKDRSGAVVPAYSERKNRQQLPANYVETGAFFITLRKFITPEARLGDSVDVFEIPEAESIDIDTTLDWVACDTLLSKKTIVFRVDAYKELGMGHVTRALTLAYELIEHTVVFACNRDHLLGIEIITAAHMPIVIINDDVDFFSWLKEVKPDVLVYDCLDSDINYITHAKSLSKRVVTFEDLGQGARGADAVINALYEGASPHSNVYSGKSYVCLRDEFLVAKPKAFSESVRRVLVMFGGTDPLNLTARIYNMAKTQRTLGVDLVFDFIIGPGCQFNEMTCHPYSGIEIHRDVSRVTDYMKRADIAISSQGRTTFELASMGVPTIVIAQNQRELLHTFAQMNNGFINLGLGSEVSDEDIAATFEWLVNAKSVRKEMRRLMLNNDLKSGIKRVRKIILGEL